MQYKIIFLLLFLTSCISHQESSIKSNKKIFVPYSSKGFALIYHENDFKNKVISKKLDNEKLQIAHRNLSRNKILILTNPQNNESIELLVTKKAIQSSAAKMSVCRYMR